MKKYVLIFAIVSVLFPFSSCDDTDRLIMKPDYPADYDIMYGIRQVMQYDEMNVNGIDLAAKFPFFDTFRLTIHYTDSKISAVTLSNGNIPFSPYDFAIPAGKTECELDTEAIPNELRIVGTDNVVAYFEKGEFSIPFTLECSALNYKYTFKSITN
jgi:hypothetical protein